MSDRPVPENETVEAGDAPTFAAMETFSPCQEKAVLALLSQAIGDRRGDRQSTYHLCRLLASYSDPPIRTGTGKKGGWPHSETAMLALGMSVDELDKLWRIAAIGGHCLDECIVEAFVPKVLWPAAWAFIAAGPEEAWERCEGIFIAWSLGLELDGKPYASNPAMKNRTLSPDGRISETTLGGYIGRGRGLMNECDRLRRSERKLKLDLLGADKPIFAKWAKADFPDCKSAEDYDVPTLRTNRQAPAARLYRLALLAHTEQIDLRRSDPDRRKGLFRPLRNRALLVAAIVSAGRRGAISRLRACDVKDDFQFHDGSRHPALILRPRKTQSTWEERPKALSALFHKWIREYMDYAGIDPESDGPLWLGAMRPSRALCPQALARALSATLSPSDDAVPTPLHRAFADEWAKRPKDRYSSHSVRRLAKTLSEQVGDEWVAERRKQSETSGIVGQLPSLDVFGAALLDHKMPGMGSLYGGYSDNEGRDLFSKVTALGIAELVAEPRGARKGPDSAAIASAAKSLALALAQRAAVQESLAEARRRAMAPVSADALNEAQMMGRLVEQQQLLIQLTVIADDLAAATAAVEHAQRDHDAAKARLVAVPDHVTTEELEALATPLDEVVPDAEPQDAIAPIVRNFGTPAEIRRAIGETLVSSQTIRRWMAGKLPFPDGDPRNVFNTSSVQIRSERRRRVRIDRLNRSRFDAATLERLDAICRLPIPPGWEDDASWLEWADWTRARAKPEERRRVSGNDRGRRGLRHDQSEKRDALADSVIRSLHAGDTT